MRDWQVQGDDGCRLGGLRWDAERPRGLVYLAHGLAEHIERYDRFAGALNGAGLSVAGHDHRGHRRSVADEFGKGHFGDHHGFGLMVRDLENGVRAWRSENPGLPLVLFGHSMGSFLVQWLLADGAAGADMIILSGSNGPPSALVGPGRLIARLERLRLGARGRSTLLHGLSFDAYNKPFEPAPTSMEWLSRDRAEVDTYVADPWCGFIATTSSWISLLGALKQLTSPARVSRMPRELPVLLASGDKDPVGDNGRGVEKLDAIYRAHGMTDLTLKLYPDARHEILNETNRDEVTADIIVWIDARLAGR